MAELKKCPFCGSGVAKIKVGSPFMWEHAIVCADCGASTKLIGAITPSIARERAIKAWNNRPTEADIMAKAIDEFAERVKSYVDCGHLCSPTELRWSDLTIETMIDTIVEQLKGG